MAEDLDVLVVDDDPDTRETMAILLGQFGYRVRTAKDAAAALAELEREPAPCVLLDLGMPGMDGVELLRFLADEHYAAPVLIVSGFDRRVLESAFRLGEALGLSMAGPLEKPVRLEELETVLGQLKATIVSDAQD